jgi:predicted RNA-binding Zn ribbon-like protein
MTGATESQGPLSVPSRAGVLPLVGGTLALDFANTTSGIGSAHWLEHLRQPVHVLAWALHAGLIDPVALTEWTEALADAAMESLLPRALALRAVIRRVALDLMAGNSGAAADRAALAIELQRCGGTGTLKPSPDGYQWHWQGVAPETILGPLVVSAIALPRWSAEGRLKLCPGEQCGWLFMDLSKNRSRRWCEMQVCGNRAKSRRYQRARHQADP